MASPARFAPRRALPPARCSLAIAVVTAAVLALGRAQAQGSISKTAPPITTDRATTNQTTSNQLTHAQTGNVAVTEMAPERTLVSPSPKHAGGYGWTMAALGTTLAVGAPDDDGGQTSAGAVYLTDPRSGKLQRTILSPNPVSYARFGDALALSTKYLVVGAPFNRTRGTEAGTAYVFDAKSGGLISELRDPKPQAKNHFGDSVAIADNWAFVDSPGLQMGSADRGRLYMFEASSGKLIRTFSNPTKDIRNSQRRVLASGKHVFLASRDHVNRALQTGLVWMFDAASGTLLRTFTHPKPERGDGFAWAIAMIGNRLYVGAPRERYNVCGPGQPTCTADAGAVHEFDTTTGAHLREYKSPKGWSDGRFGFSVSVLGSSLAIGEPGFRQDNVTRYIGAAHVFDRATGQRIASFHNPTPSDGDQMGHALALILDRLCVAAPGEDRTAKDSGAVHVGLVPGKTAPVKNTTPVVSPKTP